VTHNRLEELKEVYKLLKQKIEQVERSIRRKDEQIQVLEDTIGISHEPES
jgi:hypothetical protein